jgi:hypothetical protein
MYVNACNYVSPAIFGHREGPFYACNHARTNHVLFVYNPAGIPAEHSGCYQALDAVTYQASFTGYHAIEILSAMCRTLIRCLQAPGQRGKHPYILCFYNTDLEN